jgi:hypothetical protein
MREGAVSMRCYFLRGGGVISARSLEKATDEEGIAESKQLFDTVRKERGADGFEVWDGGRFVYRYPEKRS